MPTAQCMQVSVWLINASMLWWRPCAGQSNDGIFKWAKAGRVTCKVDSVAALEEGCLLLGSGERVACDVLVVAYGLKYQAEPAFLKELGIGEKVSATVDGATTHHERVPSSTA